MKEFDFGQKSTAGFEEFEVEAYCKVDVARHSLVVVDIVAGITSTSLDFTKVIFQL